MPTFTSSAMNPNGSYQADGMDASDQANFNLQNQRQQQSMMAQLALAQLRSGDARFAAERSDNMGMAGINALSSMNGQNLQHQDRMAEMQASANRDKAQFGYLQGRDTSANAFRDKEWMAGEALRNVQTSTLKSQAALANTQNDRLKMLETNRTAAVAASTPPDLTDPDVKQAYDLNFESTGDPATANAAARDKVREKAISTANSLAGDAGIMGADITNRSGNWLRNKPNMGQITLAHQKRDQLAAAYVKAGKLPDDALSQANMDMLGKSRDNSTFNNWRKTLEDELGVSKGQARGAAPEITSSTFTPIGLGRTVGEALSTQLQ